jgi:hypothetical protein
VIVEGVGRGEGAAEECCGARVNRAFMRKLRKKI